MSSGSHSATPSRTDGSRPFALAAMSGGVDSSVAAARLLAQGWDVAGLTMRLADAPQAARERVLRSCCAPDDLQDARRVADLLGIPFYVGNYRDVFDEAVVAPFVEAYARGLTPNPCVACNEKVKFAPLLARARGLGAEILATGHYARVEQTAEGRYRLLRGRDPAKDQSYFLYGLGQAELAFVRFPLGESTKDEVREEARRLGLSTADKADSQDVCFVGEGGHADLVEARLGRQPEGDLVHLDGRVLGRHQGVHRYTIGQRRGLGLSTPDPLYVIGIEAATARVVVGPRPALERSRLVLGGCRWVHGAAPTGPVTVQIRYRHGGVPGQVVDADSETCEIDLFQPASAAAPGQAVVLYREDEVLGGGTLMEAV